MKKCPGCPQPKPLSEFYEDKRRGHRTYCKQCEAKKREQSAAQIKTYNQKYYVGHKAQIAEHSVKYHEEHKDALNQYGREYYREVRRGPHLEADILARTKSRAKKNEIPFSITLEDIVIPHRCPVLGIEILRDRAGVKGPRPGSPSIDRIDPDKGYVKGNVRIISNRANTLKCNGTIEEFEMILADLRSCANRKGG